MDLQSRARELRAKSIEAEKLLWRHLRNRQLNGYKFRRQVPLWNYVADFVCLSPKVIVELDGGQHMDNQTYDERRSKYLESLGYTVVRFWNNEMLNNPSGVLESLTLTLKERELAEKR